MTRRSVIVGTGSALPEKRVGNADLATTAGAITDANAAANNITASAATLSVINGIGIAYAIEPLARDHVRAGRLKWLLPECAVEHDGLFLYYPRRASRAPKLRAFIEAAKAVLGSR